MSIAPSQTSAALDDVFHLFPHTLGLGGGDGATQIAAQVPESEEHSEAHGEEGRREGGHQRLEAGLLGGALLLLEESEDAAQREEEEGAEVVRELHVRERRAPRRHVPLPEH